MCLTMQFFLSLAVTVDCVNLWVPREKVMNVCITEGGKVQHVHIRFQYKHAVLCPGGQQAERNPHVSQNAEAG